MAEGVPAGPKREGGEADRYCEGHKIEAGAGVEKGLGAGQVSGDGGDELEEACCVRQMSESRVGEGQEVKSNEAGARVVAR